MRTQARLVGAAAAVAALAGCSGSPAGYSKAVTTINPAGTPSPSAQPVAAAGPAEPVTASAADSAARAYFALYGAGEYAAVYPMIAPADRIKIRESVWIGLHNACKKTTGLTYAVKHPVLTGDIAVVSVGFAGAASSLGTEQITFVYTGGKWYYQPSDLRVYAHHDLAQAVAAAKAEGLC